MCFIAMFYKTVRGFPVVLGANRDERFDRPGLTPREIRPGSWGGVDPRAGGTWLGVNARGRVVAIANRRSEQPDQPGARSRGLLCLDLLAPTDPRGVDALLSQAVDAHAYNPFNLLVADASSGWAATFADSELEVRALDPGLHMLASTPPGTTDDPKLARAAALLDQPTELDAAWDLLAAVCRDHGSRPDGTDAICVHGQGAGTVSSTLLAVHDRNPLANRYLHLQGRPCAAPYHDHSELLHSVTSAARGGSSR